MGAARPLHARRRPAARQPHRPLAPANAPHPGRGAGPGASSGALTKTAPCGPSPWPPSFFPALSPPPRLPPARPRASSREKKAAARRACPFLLPADRRPRTCPRAAEEGGPRSRRSGHRPNQPLKQRSLAMNKIGYSLRYRPVSRPTGPQTPRNPADQDATINTLLKRCQGIAPGGRFKSDRRKSAAGSGPVYKAALPACVPAGAPAADPAGVRLGGSTPPAGRGAPPYPRRTAAGRSTPLYPGSTKCSQAWS